MGKRIALIIALICFLGSGFYIGHKLYTDWKTEKEFKEIRDNTTMKTGGIDLKKLHRKNKHCVGWIRIKGTKINYPVMQTSKNNSDYYLRRGFNKKHSESGTPFLSSWSKLGKSKNYLIFGHNMKTGAMFHALPKYEKKKFYNKHKYIEFEDIKTGKHKYKVSTVLKTETYSFDYPKYAYIEGNIPYYEYIKKCRSIAIRNSKKPQFPNQLLTLSTCSYHVNDRKGRFVVVAELCE